MATHFIEKTVYFIRHGQSEGNISNNYQSPESPLSEEGKTQAKIVAERIKKIAFDVLLSSPHTRTKETTDEIIKATNKIPEYSDLFVERIKPTFINGKSSDDKEAHAVAKEWNKSLYISGYKVEDGENFDEIVARADKALEFLLNRSEKNLEFCEFCQTITPTNESVEVFSKHHRIRGLLNIKFKNLQGKIRLIVRSGWESSGDPKIVDGVYKDMIINRDQNKYNQVIKDSNSGATLHAEHESLDEHNQKIK